MIKRELVMTRAAAVALASLYVLDFVAFDGRYTEVAIRVLTAIEHSLV
jgi:hypothetical protein